MNFMSGRSGFCEEITNSTPPSPSTPNFNFRADAGEPAYPPPTVDSSHANNGGDDSNYHMRQLGEEGGSKSRSTAAVIEREHMFDKVVTPSDVGKLNRLVIPKQHAEKYFPLDSSSNEKGLLLNFEDRNGKPWRFRYSYWNSSQSYVMTKGWSRFVKEKKLDAGDIVSFQRGVGDAAAKGCLFIDWRHRPDLPEIPPPSIPHQFSFHRSSIYPWSPLFTSPAPPHFLQPPGSIAIAPNQSYFHHHQHYHHHHALTANYTVVNGNPCSPASIMYLRSASASGGAQPLTIGQTAPPVLNAVPVVQGKAAAKRLRLFGVNMECPVSESDATQPHPTISLHHLLPSPSSPGNQTQNRRSDHKGKGSISLDLDI